MEDKYINYDMCKECGGACCKECGCIYMPDDFKKIEFEYLKKLIEKGNISISGQPYTGFHGNAWSFMLYLRARNIDSDVVDLIPNGNPCKLLTQNGCSLDDKHRPKLGLLVNPTVIGGPCKKEYSSNYAKEWFEYNEVMEKLVKYYTNKEVINVIVDQIQKEIVPIKQKIKNLEELKSIEKVIANWYFNIMADKPYYTPEEVYVLERTVCLF